MTLDPVTAALNVGGKLIDRLWPDPATKVAANLDLLKMAQTGELAQLAADTDIAKAQIGVNAVEAASTSLFVSGWRPYIGWICGNVIAFKYLFGPLIEMGCEIAHVTVHLPLIQANDLWPVLGGLLGIGTMRTVEKVKGVA